MCSIQTIAMPRAAQLADRLDQLVRLRVGQAAADLVQQQHGRVGCERARQLEPLAVEQPERLGAPVGERRACRTVSSASIDAPVGAPRACARRRRSPPRARSRTRSCRRTAAAPGARARCPSRQRAAAPAGVTSASRKRTAPAVGLQRAGEDVEQRRLARAVGADDADRLAGPEARSRRRQAPPARRSACEPRATARSGVPRGRAHDPASAVRLQLAPRPELSCRRGVLVTMASTLNLPARLDPLGADDRPVRETCGDRAPGRSSPCPSGVLVFERLERLRHGRLALRVAARLQRRQSDLEHRGRGAELLEPLPARSPSCRRSRAAGSTYGWRRAIRARRAPVDRGGQVVAQVAEGPISDANRPVFAICAILTCCA